jgi:hypothetical protein
MSLGRLGPQHPKHVTGCRQVVLAAVAERDYYRADNVSRAERLVDENLIDVSHANVFLAYHPLGDIDQRDFGTFLGTFLVLADADDVNISVLCCYTRHSCGDDVPNGEYARLSAVVATHGNDGRDCRRPLLTSCGNRERADDPRADEFLAILSCADICSRTGMEIPRRSYSITRY